MARVVSLIVLTVLVLLFGVLFFRVMAGFIVPLFLAVLLAVLFRPLHAWIVARSKGYVRSAAFVTTIAVLLIIFIPVLLLTLRAATEAYSLGARSRPRSYEWRDDRPRRRLVQHAVRHKTHCRANQNHRRRRSQGATAASGRGHSGFRRQVALGTGHHGDRDSITFSPTVQR